MANKADEVFMCMSRDYTEIIAGKVSSDGVIPKAERQMRAGVAKLIEEREEANATVEDDDGAVGHTDIPEAPTAADKNPIVDNPALGVKAEVADSDTGRTQSSSPDAGDVG